MNREVYISVDCETDGPVPGVNSLRSIGACLAGLRDGDRFIPLDPKANESFYVELKEAEGAAPDPKTAEWLLEQTGLKPNDGEDPADAMQRFHAYVGAAGMRWHAKPVFVAYPLSFDWTFTHYYFHRYRGRDPFGFSSALDIKTLYAAKADVPVKDATKRNMPKHLTKTKHPHTHNALDDAMGQADLFMNIMQWGA